MTSNASPSAHASDEAATESGAPSAAEWAVVVDGWEGFEVVGPISKQTAQRIYHPANYNRKREAFTNIAAVLSRGTEAKCARLADQLRSSRALSDQEQKGARERHQARVRAALAAAEGRS